jgi:hypothetical protein
MKDREDPATYVLDYRDTLCCARLITLIRDKSGTAREKEVHVRPEHDTTSKPFPAKASSNPASKTLTIVVIIGESQQTFHVNYADVLYGMTQAHPDRNW